MVGKAKAEGGRKGIGGLGFREMVKLVEDPSHDARIQGALGSGCVILNKEVPTGRKSQPYGVAQTCQ